MPWGGWTLSDRHEMRKFVISASVVLLILGLTVEPISATDLEYSIIESCDSEGFTKDTFSLGEPVYLKETDKGVLDPECDVVVYIVLDHEPWVPYPNPGYTKEEDLTVIIGREFFGADFFLGEPVLIWESADLPGNYDIWVDNANEPLIGVYDGPPNDAVDNLDVGNAGFIVVSGEHDVAAVSQTVAENEVLPGTLVSIDVTVTNLGQFFETFHVSCYYDSVELGTVLVTDLAPAETRVVTFTWDTTGVPMNGYAIKAWADSEMEIIEVNEDNNWCTMPTPFFVVPEVPLGTISAALSMFVALIGFVGFKRFRTKR